MLSLFDSARSTEVLLLRQLRRCMGLFSGRMSRYHQHRDSVVWPTCLKKWVFESTSRILDSTWMAIDLIWLILLHFILLSTFINLISVFAPFAIDPSNCFVRIGVLVSFGLDVQKTTKKGAMVTLVLSLYERSHPTWSRRIGFAVLKGHNWLVVPQIKYLFAPLLMIYTPWN